MGADQNVPSLSNREQCPGERGTAQRTRASQIESSWDGFDMTTILLSTALGRRIRTTRAPLPEFFIRCWIGIAFGFAAIGVILVIGSTLALALLGVALLVAALPWAALVMLCVIILAAALTGASRGL